MWITEHKKDMYGGAYRPSGEYGTSLYNMLQKK